MDKNDRIKKNVAFSSVLASLFLTIFKLIVGLLTGSIGIVSEAAHSGLDFIAAFITYMAVRISGKPADVSHHYGHGKVENVSAFVETGLLIITCIWIIYEAVNRLFFKSVEIEVTWYAFVIMGISIVIDFTRSRALKRVAKQTNSQALEADALHFQSDIYSSLVVILGLIFVSLGFRGADAIAAIGVALIVTFASYRLGRRTIEVLMDTAPEGLTADITEITKKVEGVIDIRRIRVRPAGPVIFIDLVVDISRTIPFELVSKITKTIENNIKNKIKEADIVIHVNPIALEGESVVQRVQAIAAIHNASAHDIFVYSVSGKKNISFDLEIHGTDNLKKAHQVATSVENEIKNELGTNVFINTHLEPAKKEQVLNANISPNKMMSINNTIQTAIKKIPEIENIHNIAVTRNNKKLQITLHCVVRGKIKLERAHTISTRIEDLVIRSIPNVEHVIVHVEPRT